MKFDVCIQNPPYDNGLCNKFLAKSFELANISVSVMPSTWLTGQKKNKTITNWFDTYGGSIEQIIAANYFDANIGGFISINYLDIDNKTDITYISNNTEKHYTKCEDITQFSNDDKLMEFENIVKKLYSIDNLQNHLKGVPGSHYPSLFEKNPNPEWWCMRTMAFSGQSSARSKEIGEFYALMSNNITINKCIGKYKDLIKKEIKSSKTGKMKKWFEYYFSFNTYNETVNFYNYCHTTFVNICLLLHKTGLDIVAGPMKCIPWFDFNDPAFSKSPSEIDDYLFNKYIPEVDEETGITRDEIRKHIEEILPDYYGIRNIEV